MFKVITMSDSNYFECGKLFLKTRNRINANFVLYGPDLNKNQIDLLKRNNIEYVKVNENLYKTEMQFLKFQFISEQIELDISGKYDGFTFCDFDTFFINDWSHIFNKYNFDFGVTCRNEMINKKILRAYTNGGVMFITHNGFELIEYIQKLIRKGRDINLHEYDKIWRTLEIGRPKHKIHYRNELRWWNDQIAGSALVLKYFNENGYHKIEFKPSFFDFQKYRIGMFSCSNYNVLESKPDIKIRKNIFIKHLKSTGRKILGLKDIREKL